VLLHQGRFALASALLLWAEATFLLAQVVFFCAMDVVFVTEQMA
jgi:hypothetical protein